LNLLIKEMAPQRTASDWIKYAVLFLFFYPSIYL